MGFEMPVVGLAVGGEVPIPATLEEQVDDCDGFGQSPVTTEGGVMSRLLDVSVPIGLHHGSRLLLNRAERIGLDSIKQLETEMDTRLYTDSFQRPAD